MVQPAVHHALPSLDHLVEEVAVSININGINHAVMMATPDDLDDFAIGFLFCESIIRHNHDVHDIRVSPLNMALCWMLPSPIVVWRSYSSVGAG